MALYRKSKWFMFAMVGFLVIGTGAWFIIGLIDRGFSAREKPPEVEAYLARRVRYLATPSRSIRLKNPLSPASDEIAAARDYFAVNCAACHNNNGDGRTLINSGLYPPAPDLRGKETQDLTDGELFYIIRNGIRFTGMPGWEGDDENIWRLVFLIRRLSALTPKDLVLMNEINHLEPSISNQGMGGPSGKPADSAIYCVKVTSSGGLTP
jgi:mono/diheme cytochrome c family protein